MKKLLIVALAFSFWGMQCKKPETETGSIQMVIKPIFNSKPFVLNQIYKIDGKNVKFTRLLFFSATDRINYSDDNKKNGKYVQQFAFTELDDSIKSAAGVSKTIELPLGEAKQFNFKLGVESDLNALTPVDFSSANPLSDAGQYWESWKSYIFAKLEGSIDKDGDGRFETGITLHTGGNESFRSLSFSKTFTVDTQGSTKLNFDLNVNTLLTGIDLATVNSSHQTGDLPTMLKMMDNLKNAIVLK